MYDFDENQLQQLFGFALPEQQHFQAQELPQIWQGLLGSSGEHEQEQNVRDVINSGTEAAARLGQLAQSAPNNNVLAQRQAANQQALAQQAQQQAQQGQMLMKLATMFMGA